MADVLATTLLEASYQGIVFPCTDAPVQGGHDNLPHKAYGRRGADVETTGQREYRGTLTAAFINGLRGFRGVELFPLGYRTLIQTMERNPQGRLTHPTRGVMRIQIDSWTEKPSPQARNGAYIDIQWIEHNASASVNNGRSGETPQDSVQATESQLDTATDELAALPVAVTSLYSAADLAAIASMSTTVA